jgi:glutamyl/glutaminyl-tRNA synthetase
VLTARVLQGFLSAAMTNYLSLLGWNDGSEQEIYTIEELQEAFTIDRITKSAAVFDKTKLAWMNGQHLRKLPAEQARTAGTIIQFQRTARLANHAQSSLAQTARQNLPQQRRS